MFELAGPLPIAVGHCARSAANTAPNGIAANSTPSRIQIGHRSATVCHLGNIALRSGRAVTWDPAQEVMVGDEQQARMVSRPYREPWRLPDVEG